MTDLEYIKNMFDKENIRYKYLPIETNDEEEMAVIELERGQFGFVTCLSFDKYGNFKDIGAYED
jgi:hypothetical protein